ncbi:MAG TPA: hypothetical protein VN932_05285 [Rhizomicrobium sp.]|nr:hypothetical protein [Rhizomicrobium sp.]
MLIDEYLVKLGVVGDTASATKYREQLVAIGSTATAVVGMITGAIGAVGAYFAAAVGDLDDLGDMAKNTDTSVAFIQEMGYAASQMGSSTEAARSSIQGLSRVMGEAANGVGRGAKMFQKFGISVKNADGTMRDMGDVIGQIQGKMQHMNAQQQTAFLSRLGIDASMRQVLSMTSDEFGKLIDQAREWGVNSDEQADAASTINNRFKDLKFGLQQFRTMIGLSLIPTMDRLIGGFKEWFTANRVLVQDGLMRLFSVAGYVIQVISNFVTFVDTLVKSTIGWKNAILLLAAAWAIWNRAMLLNPVTWIVAAIVGLLLLIDDLMGYMEGKDSLLGAFWGPFLDYTRDAWETMKQLGGAFADLYQAAKPVLDYFAATMGDSIKAGFDIILASWQLVFGQLLDGMKMLTAIFRGDLSGFVDAWVSSLTRIKTFAEAVFGAIAGLIDNTLGRAGAFIGTLVQGGGIGAAFKAATTAVGAASAGAQTPAALGPPSFAAGGAAPATGAPTAAATGAGGSSLTQHVDINIQSTDPAAAGREAARALTDTARRSVATTAPTVVQ